MTAEREVEILKSRIIQRPSEILCIHNELFKVSERAVIYKPMYEVIARNLKTEKETSLTIDAISGKTKSGMQQTPAPQKKQTIKEPTKPSASAKTAVAKVSSPAKKS
jgi:hypothetical protein